MLATAEPPVMRRAHLLAGALPVPHGPAPARLAVDSQRAAHHCPANPTFRVARDLSDVIASWRVVYDVYLRSGFIHPNPYLIHTSPQMVSNCSAVFQSLSNGVIESTLTAVVDGDLGLPLDSVYKAELDALRSRGRRLTEYGLFAHVRQLATSEPENDLRRRGHAIHSERHVPPDSRVNVAIVQLMRLAFYFALSRNSTDFVIGVHPRHARFYGRAFGFKQFGPARSYAAVNHRPVVLLYGNLDESLRMSRVPHALEFCLSNPVPADAFSHRYSFDYRDLASAPIRIDAYLRAKRREALLMAAAHPHPLHQVA